MRAQLSSSTSSGPVVWAPNDEQLLFSETIPSTTSAIEPIVTRLMCVLARRGWFDDQRIAVELALREAIANAIIHGNEGNPRKRVALDCYERDDHSIQLVVRDQGHGFDATRVGDPTQPENIRRTGGRGIYLMRHFMDDVQFAQGGSEIRMSKRR